MPAVLSDRDSWTAAICADPADDTVRLAFADWLDEQGEGERAEFIRLQIELASTRYDRPLNETPNYYCAECGALWRLWPDPSGWSLCSDACGACCDNAEMGEQIEQILLDDWAKVRRSTGLISDGWYSGWWDTGSIRPNHQVGSSKVYWTVTAGGLITANIRRGLIDSVRCDLQSWRAHGPAIVRAHPVERVVLTDRDPAPGSPRTTAIGWVRERPGTSVADGADVVPVEVYDALLPNGRKYAERDIVTGGEIITWTQYDTAEAANEALSAAALAFAKSAPVPA